MLKRKLTLTKANDLTIANKENHGLIWKTGVDGEKIWMGILEVQAHSNSNAQHHNNSEVALYLLEGKVVIQYGENFDQAKTLSEGDFVYVSKNTLYKLNASQLSKFVAVVSPSFNVTVLKDSQVLNNEKSGEVKIIEANKLNDTTKQTTNMPRRTGVETPSLWIGRVTGDPGKDSGAHHHGEADTGGFIISGHTRILYGEKYEQYEDFFAGDFVHVPPFIPHIERNMSDEETVEFVTTRNPANIVVNLKDKVYRDEL